MRLVVCIKQIFHIYASTGRKPEEYFLSLLDSVARINPLDESALEIALGIKKIYGNGEIIILTLGPIIAEKELRRCLAMGADDIYQIDTAADLDPWQKSALLARAIKKMGSSIVFCGKESLDTQNGQIGAFLGMRLEMPFVSAVSNLQIKDKHILEVTRSAGRGIREIIECSIPAVLSVDMGTCPPRLPTYEAKVKSYSLPIKRLRFNDELVSPKSVSAGIMQPRPRPKKVPTPESRLDSFDRIGQLLSGSRIDKKGVILKGNPENQVKGITLFLKENGFLKSE